MAGPFVAPLVGGVEGAAGVGGLPALGAALTQIGVPKDPIMRYEAPLKVDRYLPVAHGSAEDQETTHHILEASEMGVAA